jgi:hypothetical protein
MSGSRAGCRPDCGRCAIATYQRCDLVAGLTVAAFLVPQVLAYVGVAGMQPVAGLWAAAAALGVYTGLCCVGRGQAGLMRRSAAVPAPRSSFVGFRFPREVIMLAVRWYLRYGLSYRDVEELPAERGIVVDHVTIYRWVQRFTPELIDAARPSRHIAGNRWFVDKTYQKVAGRWEYLYRAIDQYGQVIDVLASPKRDLAATRRFFARP